MIKEWLKKLLLYVPIPITKNHKYDLQTKRIISRLANNANAIDVGCYKGEILDLLIKAAPDGYHYGIEPIPKQYEYLKKKYEDNDHIKIINIAASDESQSTTFNYVVSNPSYSGLKKRDYDKKNEEDTSIIVQTDPLDDVIPKEKVIDFIKIDVEGAEFQVLNGATKIIDKGQPIIVFEHGLGASDKYGTNPDDLFNFFNKKEYHINTLSNYLKKAPSLTREEFSKQYHQRKNYYFIAFPKE